MDKTVAELFAGVGGFRCALNDVKLGGDGKAVESGEWDFVFANQWEPSTKKQDAYECYKARFGGEEATNEDIFQVDKASMPDFSLLVGGFPCQDYSIAQTLSKSKGIEGKKGVLWWAINDILNTKKPAFVFLENVDRLLLSPSKQRGRDFGIILRCFHEAGYDVQWRVINAGEYGYQQKRRRAYIVAYRSDTEYAQRMGGFTPREIICSGGIFSKGFPVKPDFLKENAAEVGKDAYSMIGQLSEEFRADFFNAGVMIDGSVYTAKTESDCDETFALRNLLEADGVDEHYFLDRDKCEKFKYLKGSKRIPRKKPNGEDYIYSEGAMPCPDNPDVPARTILTSESGTSRTTHVVSDPKTGKWRLLTPVECERINGFPDGWTDTGMTEKRRYFMMGNALVVDVVAVIGQAIGEVIEQES